MYPQLFEIPFLHVTVKTWGVMLVIGFLAALWLINRLSRNLAPDTQTSTTAALYCLIAFLLVQLLRLLARRAGDTRSVTAILADLNEVQECLVVPVLRSPDERPHLETGLNVTDPAQRRLLNAVGIQGLPAATSA